MIQTSPDYATFCVVAMDRQCLNFHESKDILVKMIVNINIKVAIIIMNYS